MNTEAIKLPQTVWNEKYGIHIRPYLKGDEIVNIAEGALKMDNPFEQEVAIAVNTILCCTDANEDGVIDNMPIDDIMFSGLWQTVADEVMNLDMVMAYMHYKENAEIAIANFLNTTLPKFMDNLDKDMNKYIKRLPKGAEWDDFMKNTPKMLEDVLEQVKKDGNAEIIKGAMKMGGEE